MRTMHIADIIRQAREEHDLPVRKDDPVMILATIMDVIVDNQSKAILAMYDKYREEHADLANQWRHDAKEAASHILNNAVAAGKTAMANGILETANKVAEITAHESKKNLDALRRETERLKKYVTAVIAWSAAAVASSVAAVLFALIFR